MRKFFLFIILFLIPSVSFGARVFTTSTISSSTIRLHITADTFAELIAPKADCGTNTEWAFFATKGGTAYQSSNQIYSEATLDVTEDITLTSTGTYKWDLIWGSDSSDWDNLYNVQSCAATDYTMNDFLGSTTIPMDTSGGSSSSSFLNATTSDFFWFYTDFIFDILIIIAIASLVYVFLIRV